MSQSLYGSNIIESSPHHKASLYLKKQQEAQRITSTTSICSWADPYELNKLLENFAVSPTSHYSSPHRQSEQAIYSQANTDVNYIPYNPASSLRRPSIADALYGANDDFSESPRRRIPSKAQRLMGVGAHEQVFEKSTFFDSDDEEDEGRQQAPRISSPGSKSDSRILFRSAPKSKPRHRSRTPPLTRQPNLFEEGLFPPASPSVGPELSSKWSALSNRLRGGNTGAAIKILTKKRNSTSFSQSKGSIDMFGNAYNLPTGDEPISPESDVLGTPRRESFSVGHLERSPEVPRKDSPNWNEARAASKALEYAVEAPSQDVRNGVSLHSRVQNSFHQSPPSAIKKGDMDLTVSPYPLRSLHSTSPLSFDVHRRPKVPFQSLDTTPSRQVSIQNKKYLQEKIGSPIMTSPQPPPYQPKTNIPTLVMRPSPTVKDKKSSLPLHSGRRESECDIFSDAAEDFAATMPAIKNATPILKKKSTSPRQAKTSIPPRRPPPQGAVPLPPSVNKLTQQSLQFSEAMQREDAMTRIASAMMMSPPTQNTISKEKKSIQVNPKKMRLPKRDSFSAESMTDAFTATMSLIKCQGLVKEAKVDLLVSGVLFETCLSQLSNHDSAIDDGLMSWLKKQIVEKSDVEMPVLPLPMTKTQSIPLNLMHIKNKPSIVSCHSSLSSEEEEAEEMTEVDAKGEPFYEVSPISRLRWSSVDDVLDERVDPMMKVPLALEPLQLTAPLRINRSHARTPTSVSTDLDLLVDGEVEEGDDIMIRHGDCESTPDLVGSHAFVFMSSPSSRLTSSSSNDNYIQINLDRNPQSYPFIFHLLKHGSLPRYFHLKQFPSLERKRALLALERECTWLGYNLLADICLNALGDL